MNPIQWPEGFRPEQCCVHVHNELLSEATAEALWAALITATKWPDWYRHCKNVRIDGGADQLAPDAQFRWSTGGVAFSTKVVDFDPTQTISWTAVNPVIQAHHAWQIEQTDRGSLIVTEETQRGALPWATRPISRQQTNRLHREWLTALADRALTT
jgi:hypothetical protein